MSLFHVVWELTLKCDLACGHCGSRAGRTRTRELDTSECLDVVAQLADMGAREVSLIGGEAYLRDDWDTIAAAIVDRGMRCTMVTGGRGFTPERASRAAGAGVWSVSVSIDGLREAHDRQRNLAGSFDAAVAAITNLRAAGVLVSANSQINRLSAPDLDGMLDLFLAHRLHGWQVAMTVPMGRAADRPEWLLQPYELLELFPRLEALSVRGRTGGLVLYPGNNVGYFGPHERTLRGSLEEDGLRHWEGCNAGVTTLGIEADGTIKGCPSLPTTAYAGGNVRDRSVRAIWETTHELGFARDDRADELWGFCKGCYYAPTCKAGCSWTAHVFFGRRGNNPYCHHRALEHEHAGLRERLVRVQAPPGAPFDHGRFDIVVEPAADAARDPAPRRLPVMMS
ncbi:MAG: heme biosynthesis protein [Myxococcaceae bacterium]|nr:heme biosynthesis protein [Myxococcaceae bacterium]